MRAFLLVLALLPTAAASGSLDAGPITVGLENGHEHDCVEHVSKLCVASWERSSDESAINATQHVASLTLLVEPPPAEGVYLLPGGELVIDARDFRFEQPAIRLATLFVGERRLPGALSSYGLEMNETGISAYYFGLNPGNFNEPPQNWRRPVFRYGPEGLTYGEIAVPTAGSSGVIVPTDATSYVWIVCEASHTSGCHESNEELLGAYDGVLPDVVVGAGLTTFEVAVDRFEEAEAVGMAANSTSSPMKAGTSSRVHRLTLAPSLSLSVESQSPQRTVPPEWRSTPWRAHEDSRAVPVVSAGPAAPPPLLPALAASAALAVLLAALYARIRSRHEALAHASRARLLATLEARGPLTVTDLARALAVDRSTALYHIRVLRRSASVSTMQQGRLVFVALPGQELPAMPPRFRDGASEVVISVLRAAGGALPRADLHAQAAVVPQRQRNEVLRQLTEAGVLERAFVGNAEVVRLARAP